MTKEQIIERIKKIEARLMEDRDEISDLIDHLQALEDDCADAIGDLSIAAETLSKYL